MSLPPKTSLNGTESLSSASLRSGSESASPSTFKPMVSKSTISKSTGSKSVASKSGLAAGSCAFPGVASPVMLSLILPINHLKVSLLGAVAMLSHLLDESLPGNYELLLVGGNEADPAYHLAGKVAAYYPHVRLLDKQDLPVGLSMSGLWQIAEGDYMGVMAAHLQDAPEVVLQLLEKLEQGCDVAVAKRSPHHSDIFAWTIANYAPSQEPQTVSSHLLSHLLAAVASPDQGCFLARRSALKTVASGKVGPATLEWNIYRKDSLGNVA